MAGASCGSERPQHEREAVPTSDASAVAAGPPADAPRAAALQPPRSPDCLRGGSTREEVRAVMGEPDSVSFGAWIYGRSSVSFGYGTVVELTNEGGNLIVC